MSPKRTTWWLPWATIRRAFFSMSKSYESRSRNKMCGSCIFLCVRMPERILALSGLITNGLTITDEGEPCLALVVKF